MPPAGFETKILEDERPQTYALDRAAIATGKTSVLVRIILLRLKRHWIQQLIIVAWSEPSRSTDKLDIRRSKQQE
jgi:hypothetical protein